MSEFSTKMVWAQTHWIVELLSGGQVVVQMSLDDWMDLGAVKYAAEEIIKAQQAEPGRPGN